MAVGLPRRLPASVKADLASWLVVRFLKLERVQNQINRDRRELGRLHVAYATYNRPNIPWSGLVLASGRSRRRGPTDE